MDAVTSSQPTVEFLRRRFASAIRSGDGRTASRLRLELDRLMNPIKTANPPPPDPDLPPAA